MFIADSHFARDREDHIRHGFFGRRGGVSTGFYTSLNCGLGRGDDPQAVETNRVAVGNALGLAKDHLLGVYQVHGNVCTVVREAFPLEGRPEADAMATDVPGLGLGVLTADCAPVLFCGQKEDGSPVVGAAHAGWRGALDGILESTIRAMIEDLGAMPQSLRTAIGPCIAQSSYEVDSAFRDSFLTHDKNYDALFNSGARAGSFQFDLPGFVRARLSAAGVGDISLACHSDTYSHEHDYFSFRRTTHRNEPDFGTQIAVIAINPEQ